MENLFLRSKVIKPSLANRDGILQVSTLGKYADHASVFSVNTGKICKLFADSLHVSTSLGANANKSKKIIIINQSNANS